MNFDQNFMISPLFCYELVGADSMPPVFVKDVATCPTAGAAGTNGYEWQVVSELIQSCHEISSNVATADRQSPRRHQ